jgi:hypothetical protein
VAAPSLDYSATDRYCAEELLILLVNFMKIYRADFQNNETEVILYLGINPMNISHCTIKMLFSMNHTTSFWR